MRIADALLGIPYIVLVVAVSGVVGAGLGTLILILGLTGWVSSARVTRGKVLALRDILDLRLRQRWAGACKRRNHLTDAAGHCHHRA